jgi:hypothetical protein
VAVAVLSADVGNATANRNKYQCCCNAGDSESGYTFGFLVDVTTTRYSSLSFVDKTPMIVSVTVLIIQK